ncbi:MAG: transcriptional regulator [Methylococcaceae bacterium]|nr:transcriptional regulator [Methylococcaceae bacterium]
MQLTITALGSSSTCFISKILKAISNCNCQVLSLKYSSLAQVNATYLLVNGNWNQIAKLETTLEGLQKKLEIHFHTLRTDSLQKKSKSIPYSLEIVSLPGKNIVEEIIIFLVDQEICIEEINVKQYQPSITQANLFLVDFILSVPEKIIIPVLRDELHIFSENLNLDLIFNPII